MILLVLWYLILSLAVSDIIDISIQYHTYHNLIVSISVFHGGGQMAMLQPPPQPNQQPQQNQQQPNNNQQQVSNNQQQINGINPRLGQQKRRGNGGYGK